MPMLTKKELISLSKSEDSLLRLIEGDTLDIVILEEELDELEYQLQVAYESLNYNTSALKRVRRLLGR